MEDAYISMINKQEMFKWAEAHADEQKELLKAIAAIPAPSHHEERRAHFIKDWLVRQGAADVIIDEALNVVMPFPGKNSGPYTAFTAHTDIVFPDMDTISVKEENGILYAPGIGDDTANLVNLMLIAKFVIEKKTEPASSLLFVFNSCEEGLGNLKGIRQICREWDIKRHVSFDLYLDKVVCRAVGSERWRVSCKTKGGHSYGAFGNPNAIAAMAEMISRLYDQDVPAAAGRKTTYNVGEIRGGTSVNTIAQNAEMLYEYRSDDLACLAQMRKQFFDLFDEMNCEDTVFEKELIGERPCSAVKNNDELEELINSCSRADTEVTGREVEREPLSTDCNIPLSLGIPATCVGLCRGGKAHTREEWVEAASLIPGLKVGLNIVNDLCF